VTGVWSHDAPFGISEGIQMQTFAAANGRRKTLPDGARVDRRLLLYGAITRWKHGETAQDAHQY
jgi:hypothetical protein